MRIWVLNADVENYDSLSFPSEDDRNMFSEYEFDGRNQLSNWKPVKVIDYEGIIKGDMPGLPGVPVFSERAVIELNQLLNDQVELLPLNHPTEKYYIINVVNVVDAVDYENSKVKRFSSSGRVMRFDKYAFHLEPIKNQHIFKIPELPKAYVFVSDEFRDRVLNSALTGFQFIEVWDANID